MGILIIDDTPVSLFLLENILEEGGYSDIHCVGSGQEALEILSLSVKPSSRGIDIILLDAALPGMDGIETCRRIKADPRFRDIPIVLITIRDDEEVLDQAFAAGASDYILKPIKVGELLARVRSTLQLKREIDRRKDKECQLIELSSRLARYDNESLAGPTPITGENYDSKPFFDKLLKREWDRAKRDMSPLSLILVAFGELAPVSQEPKQFELFKMQDMAEALMDAVKRPGDSVMQYENGVFAVILPNTDRLGALVVAASFKSKVAEIEAGYPLVAMVHPLELNMGVAALTPENGGESKLLLAQASAALSVARTRGKGRIEYFADPGHEWGCEHSAC